MKNFKKMLAAVSAVTIAFGAMALTASASTTLVNGANTADQEYIYAGVSDFNDNGGFFTATYSVDTDAKLQLVLICGGSWDWKYLDPSAKTDNGDGTYTVTYSNADINETLAGDELHALGLKNDTFYGWDDVNKVSIPYTGTITLVAGPSYAFNAVETKEGMIDGGDGWCAKVYTFSYNSDKAVKYSANVNGRTISGDTAITGEVTYGLIVGAPIAMYDTLYGMSAPVITVQ